MQSTSPICFALAVGVAIASCAPADQPLRLTLEQRGEQLFTEETFDGNGRVCSTCHELEQFGTITPAFVQDLFERDPDNVLFRPIDSDDGLGISYERLKEHATVRVPIQLVAQEATGLSVRKCEAPQDTLVFFNRGNPTVFNVALDQHLMHDGRENDDLPTQALNAVLTHNEPGRDATTDESAAMAAFQESLFSHQALQTFLNDSAALQLPTGTTASEIRGRTFFEPNRPCGICHSGPLLNRTSEFHPNAVGLGFESSLVGMEPENPNQKYDWCYFNPETNEIVPGPSGTTKVFERPAADPGRGLIPGSTAFTLPDGTTASESNDVLVNLVGPMFKIPTLWGIPNTAPYFHDNSAKDLNEVLDHYNFAFAILLEQGFTEPGCDPNAPVCLSEQDKTDIIAFLQLLSFDELGIGIPSENGLARGTTAFSRAK